MLFAFRNSVEIKCRGMIIVCLLHLFCRALLRMINNLPLGGTAAGDTIGQKVFSLCEHMELDCDQKSNQLYQIDMWC